MGKKLILIVALLITIVINAASQSSPIPYPIIFVHGLTGNSNTFGGSGSTVEQLQNNFNLNPPKVLHICLNHDQNNSTAVVGSDVVLVGWTEFEQTTLSYPTLTDRLFIINLDGDEFQNVVGHGNHTLSNQAAIVKQGFALKLAIQSVLNATQAEKVILVGHSMGGLAIREYLQRTQDGTLSTPHRWWVDPNDDQHGHKIASVVTIGTPHLGSNLLNFLSKEQSNTVVPDVNSEAVRDLRYSYGALDSWPPDPINDVGVYLFGGIENLVQGSYYNADFNCDGDENDIIFGLNDPNTNGSDNPAFPLSGNVKYTWITSDDGGLGEGDNVVRLDRQYLYTTGDTLLTDKTHGEEPNDFYTIIRGLDEPSSFSLAYAITLGITVQGLITYQPFFSSTDEDVYKVQLDDTGAVTITIDGTNSGVTNLALYDASQNLITSSSVTSFPAMMNATVGSGTYYVKVTGTATTNTWQNPYSITVTHQPVVQDNSWSICTYINTQEKPKIVYDGLGGGIIAWKDYRSKQFFAQRVNPNGFTIWHPEGTRVGQFYYYYNQYTDIPDLKIASDQNGGCFITYGFYCCYGTNVFAKINSNGESDWEGLYYVSSFYNSSLPELVSDQTGNIFLSIGDAGGFPEYKLYRYNNNGTLVWGPIAGGGIVLATDENGGVFSVYDNYNYWQRLGSDGTILWTIPGWSSAMVADGTGGAIILVGNIYGQRVNSVGQYVWATPGIPIDTVPSSKININIITDNLGGAIFSWEDNRNGNWDIYAQRINIGGTILWQTNGIPITSASGDQSNYQIISDGAGGAILVWEDNRNGNRDIYAQRIDGNGNALWTTNGVAVTNNSSDQYEPQLCTDGANGAFIVWTDERNGNKDIYAQHILSDGSLSPAAPVTRRLEVVSSNSNANVSITVSPDDLLGKGNGTTPMYRTYGINTTVTLTAPLSDSIGSFERWEQNGLPYSTNRTITVTMNDTYVMTARYTSPTPPPSSWNFAQNTGRNATIVIPTSATLKIGTRTLKTGDAIGVFFVRDNDLICAGYKHWIQGQNIAITAWGDDDQTPTKDGFDENELLRFKIWDADHQREYNATPTFLSGGSVYVTNGTYVISSLQGKIVHSIQLSQGWNMISSYVDPVNPSLDTMLAEIIPNMVLMKNGVGQVYWPSLSINQIGAWNKLHGYQIYMQNADNLPNAGMDIIPEAVSFPLSSGWNMISYLRNGAMRIDSALSSVNNNLVIAKNNNGQVYWPEFSINAIGSMQTGQGYQVYLSQSSALVYPSNTSPTLEILPKQTISSRTKKSLHNTSETHFTFITTTGNNATIGIPTSANPNIDGLPISSGDEIGVFTSSGLCVGAMVWSGENNAITVWGDNDQTPSVDGIQNGEQLYFRVWQQSSGLEYAGSEVNYSTGNGVYTSDGIYILSSLGTSNVPLPIQLASFHAVLTQEMDIQLSWSTASETNNYGFYVECKQDSIGLFTTVSELIPGAGTTLEEQHYTWTDSNVTLGTYFYRLKQVDLNGDFTYSYEIMIEVSNTVKADENPQPIEFTLEQNYPNPFNPTTTISYALPENSRVQLKIYNVFGQIIKTLVDEVQNAGYKFVEWNSEEIASGIYFYRIDATSINETNKPFTQVRKMLLIR
jgi:pimeloyl-ACP methyl ester carboxylesterase